MCLHLLIAIKNFFYNELTVTLIFYRQLNYFLNWKIDNYSEKYFIWNSLLIQDQNSIAFFSITVIFYVYWWLMISIPITSTMVVTVDAHSEAIQIEFLTEELDELN